MHLRNAKSLSTFLHELQKEGANYGLQFNKDKCGIIRISRSETFTQNDEVTFLTGENVKIANQAKYLGCWLNDKGDPQREVRQRISTCMAILEN